MLTYIKSVQRLTETSASPSEGVSLLSGCVLQQCVYTQTNIMYTSAHKHGQITALSRISTNFTGQSLVRVSLVSDIKGTACSKADENLKREKERQSLCSLI